MHKSINIWGRDFNLEVMFDNYEDKDATPIQKEAWQAFLMNLSLLESCKSHVEQYCLKNNSSAIGTTSIDNIFKYVIPEAIYIKNTRDNSRVVALVCAYKFDEDNGLAVIFKNETFSKVGTQNII